MGTTSLVIAILAAAPSHQTGKFVFRTFIDGTGDPGWSVRASPAYVVIVGILMAQYTMTGKFFFSAAVSATATFGLTVPAALSRL